MNIAQVWNKTKPYIHSGSAYWRESDWIRSENSKDSCGPFMGLNLIDRLNDGHYDIFDDQGLPVRIVDGKPYRSFSTVFSYALAGYEMFLLTSDDKHLRALKVVYTEVIKRAQSDSNGALVFPHHGSLSAMNQGEALSIVARLNELDSRDEYLECAEKIIKPYTYLVSEGGVKTFIKEDHACVWYEEYPDKDSKHVLNGMCYAMAGLLDTQRSMPTISIATQLFEDGVRSMERSLHFFDTEYWSSYWFDEYRPNYIASVMYHNLHIVQLGYLGNASGSQILKDYSSKFNTYLRNPLNRAKAAYKMLGSKLGA